MRRAASWSILAGGGGGAGGGLCASAATANNKDTVEFSRKKQNKFCVY